MVPSEKNKPDQGHLVGGVWRDAALDTAGEPEGKDCVLTLGAVERKALLHSGTAGSVKNAENCHSTKVN